MPAQRLPMRQVRETLRLTFPGTSLAGRLPGGWDRAIDGASGGQVPLIGSMPMCLRADLFGAGASGIHCYRSRSPRLPTPLNTLGAMDRQGHVQVIR